MALDTKPGVVQLGRHKRLRWRIPRMRLRYLFLAAVCGWAGYVYFFVQGPIVHRLDAQEESLSKQMAAETSRNAKLQNEVSQLNSDEYVARVARKDYGLVKPGDILYTPGH